MALRHEPNRLGGVGQPTDRTVDTPSIDCFFAEQKEPCPGAYGGTHAGAGRSGG